MRLDQPDLHTEYHRLHEQELRRRAEWRRQAAGQQAPLGRRSAAMGTWLRALADRSDPATQLDRGVMS